MARASLTARMAAALAEVPWMVDVLLAATPDDAAGRLPGEAYPKSTREVLEPSARKLAELSRGLDREYRQRRAQRTRRS